MWDYVGIIRSETQLLRAYRRINNIFEEVEDYYRKSKLNTSLLELRNLTAIAHLITTSALRRKESRGTHYRSDFPESSDIFLKDTIIS